MSFEQQKPKLKFAKVQVNKEERDDRNINTSYSNFSKNPNEKIGNKYSTPNEFTSQAKEWDENNKDLYSVVQIVGHAILDNIEYTDINGESVENAEYIPNIIKNLLLHGLGHIGIDTTMQLITDLSMLMQGLDIAKEKYKNNPEVSKKIEASYKFLLQSTTGYAKGRMEELRVVSEMEDDKYMDELGYNPEYKTENDIKIEKLTGLNERELVVNDGIVNGYMLASILKNMYPHEISERAYQNFLQTNQDLLSELSNLDDKTIKLLILHNKKKDSLSFGLTNKNTMRNMNGVEENGDKENLTSYYLEKGMSQHLRNFGIELLEIVENLRKSKSQ
jgi:hypothetical protein